MCFAGAETLRAMGSPSGLPFSDLRASLISTYARKWIIQGRVTIMESRLQGMTKLRSSDGPEIMGESFIIDESITSDVGTIDSRSSH